MFMLMLLLCCSKFIIMSQVTVTTNSPPVTVVCSITLATPMTYDGFHLPRASNSFGSSCGSATTIDSNGHSKKCC